ncbi:hypothetical protein ADUPG1_011816 [Aduncisulcus paluster]|uniref:Uncharacterized protein n=1 Tax=Aduncisulcus paluster TaxID=2918883 RepID=A0ABQ5JX94_9EUKA|nr:hypothetical protein ADUPG1_011816 [Aduncisulcus paluster]
MTEELKVRELSKVELMEKKSGKEKKLEMLENKLKKLRRWSKVDVDQLFGELEDGEKRAETLGREIQSLYTRINSIRHSVEKEEEASKRKIREERKVLRAASAASDKLRKTLAEGDSDEKDTQKRIEMVDMTMSAFGAAPDSSPIRDHKLHSRPYLLSAAEKRAYSSLEYDRTRRIREKDRISSQARKPKLHPIAFDHDHPIVMSSLGFVPGTAPRVRPRGRAQTSLGGGLSGGWAGLMVGIGSEDSSDQD